MTDIPHSSQQLPDQGLLTRGVEVHWTGSSRDFAGLFPEIRGASGKVAAADFLVQLDP